MMRSAMTMAGLILALHGTAALTCGPFMRPVYVARLCGQYIPPLHSR